MHRELADKGLVAISVSLDDPHDANSIQQVREFLGKVGANFTNFLLDEPEEVWGKKLDIGGPPLIIVFGRDGRVAKRFTGGYDEVRPLVEKLLGTAEQRP
ncbi:MAG: hypothetical protein RMJ19_05110 [Gemmatales bacterium]|nr:hypothetical protein [Gemmatales bacterium]MDW8175031.1 hypothetical protein [Gemmatales bacterium]